MLTVSSLTNPAETVSSYNTLEAVTFGGAGHIDEFTFGKYGDIEGFAELLAGTFLEAGEFHADLFGCCVGFGKVTLQRLGGVFFLSFAERQLNGVVTVFLFCFYLRYHTRTSFDHSARHVTAGGIPNASHSDFLSN